MSKRPRNNAGFRLDLGEPLASDLADLCAASYKGSQTEVIREALAEHIARRLEEPVMRARFNAARQKRLAETD
jgi:hypothetical protein